MSHETVFDSEHRLVVLTLRGPYTMPAIIQMLKELHADPRNTPGTHILSDFRAAQFVVRGDEVRDLIDTMASAIRAHGPHRSAAVVSSATMYGLSRMVGSYLELQQLPTDFRIFTDRAEAEAWLKEQTDA
jgi:hypothetical protein